MVSKMTPLELIAKCLKDEQNFVLQGGAGSGKTETLKELLEYISENNPQKKIVCITHTNKAVEEIANRVDNGFIISTIHSFINDIIKNFKINIHKVIFEIFKLELCDSEEHKVYKRCYEKYSNKLYSLRKETCEKVVGKREFDKQPNIFISDLNQKIELMNTFIESEIKKKDTNKIKYNETVSDNFNNLTFSHDSLLKIAYHLFESFPLIGKIVQDKFDYIFIDEYQDTNPQIIKIFLEKLPKKNKTVIGLFGDSMRGIYKEGIGDVRKYIESGILIRIQKPDNFRCSDQVIGFINKLRDDDLEQKIALKDDETIQNRQGKVSLFYTEIDSKPSSRDREGKEIYINKLENIITKLRTNFPDYKVLMLTNKSIAGKLGFKNLYNLFANRYKSPNEKIEEVLTKIGFKELYELCTAFRIKNYNFVISKVKKYGFIIQKSSDIKNLKSIFQVLNTDNFSLIDAFEFAVEKSVFEKSDNYNNYIDYKDLFIKDLASSETYNEFTSEYEKGNDTFTKLIKIKNFENLNEQEFKELKYKYIKGKFFEDLFSKKICEFVLGQCCLLACSHIFNSHLVFVFFVWTKQDHKRNLHIRSIT